MVEERESCKIRRAILEALLRVVLQLLVQSPANVFIEVTLNRATGLSSSMFGQQLQLQLLVNKYFIRAQYVPLKLRPLRSGFSCRFLGQPQIVLS